MTVENITNARGNKVANQFIIRNGNVVTFQSYESTICEIDYLYGTITFGRDWDYSVTTTKHLYQFLRDESFDLANLNNRKSIQKAIDEGKYTDYWEVNYIDEKNF